MMYILINLNGCRKKIIRMKSNQIYVLSEADFDSNSSNARFNNNNNKKKNLFSILNNVSESSSSMLYHLTKHFLYSNLFYRFICIKNVLFLLYIKSKKKRNTPIFFNTNYRTEMKLVPIIMDYCLI